MSITVYFIKVYDIAIIYGRIVARLSGTEALASLLQHASVEYSPCTLQQGMRWKSRMRDEGQAWEG